MNSQSWRRHWFSNELPRTTERISYEIHIFNSLFCLADDRHFLFAKNSRFHLMFVMKKQSLKTGDVAVLGGVLIDVTVGHRPPVPPLCLVLLTSSFYSCILKTDVRIS